MLSEALAKTVTFWKSVFNLLGKLPPNLIEFRENPHCLYYSEDVIFSPNPFYLSYIPETDSGWLSKGLWCCSPSQLQRCHCYNILFVLSRGGMVIKHKNLRWTKIGFNVKREKPLPVSGSKGCHMTPSLFFIDPFDGGVGGEVQGNVSLFHILYVIDHKLTVFQYIWMGVLLMCFSSNFFFKERGLQEVKRP